MRKRNLQSSVSHVKGKKSDSAHAWQPKAARLMPRIHICGNFLYAKLQVCVNQFFCEIAHTVVTKCCPKTLEMYTELSVDEYVYCTPIPKHTLKYTKVKVHHTQDKHTQLSSLALLPLTHQSMLTHTHYQLATCALKNSTLAEANLPEYVDTYTLLPIYLCPKDRHCRSNCFFCTISWPNRYHTLSQVWMGCNGCPHQKWIIIFSPIKRTNWWQFEYSNAHFGMNASSWMVWMRLHTHSGAIVSALFENQQILNCVQFKNNGWSRWIEQTKLSSTWIWSGLGLGLVE